MCSHCPSTERRARLRTALILAALCSGCHRGPMQSLPSEQPDRLGVDVSAIVPGVGRPRVSEDPRATKYFDNAEAVGAGARLFKQYNCNGCHSSGGGGMGPDLMDAQWIYGSRLTQIHQTLVEGRPNGMPAWGGKIPDEQLWQLAAYVRSLSLPQTIAADTDDTPGQTPAPVPRAADQDAGWSPPPETTTPYGSTIEGPAYEAPSSGDTSTHQPPKSKDARRSQRAP